MQKYILLADCDERILDIEETALKYFYGGEVVLARTSPEAIKAINNKGRPEIIFVDHELLIGGEAAFYRFLEEKSLHVPVVSCVSSVDYQNDIQDWPLASAVLVKPVSIEQFTHIVKGITSAPVVTPGHIAVKLKTVLDFANSGFDFYLRLSKDNYVKIVKEEDAFTQEDADKLLSRGIKEVHIRASDSHRFLSECEKSLKALFDLEASKFLSEPSLALEAFVQIEGIARAFGWSREVVVAARKTVDSAITVLNKNPEIVKALKTRLANRYSHYARHIGTLTYLNCILSAQLGWGGDNGQIKLVMASLLHDLAVDEDQYNEVGVWNKRASDLKDRSPESLRYRLHPLEAAKLAQTLDVLPPDVDQIILQHHEKPDGSGFPRGLGATRIGHHSAFFIMMEELVSFIGDGENLETSLKDYLTWGEAYYSEGYFKKIFSLLKEKITLQS